MDGYVLWWEHWDDDCNWHQLGPFAVHRPGCMYALERQVKGLNDPRWIGRGMSRRFKDFVEQLAYNASHPFDLKLPRAMHIPDVH